MNNKDDELVRTKLGGKFKVAREATGLTQAEVAAKAKISANYYAMVERGEGNLSVEKLHRIMKVLNIKSDLL